MPRGSTVGLAMILLAACGAAHAPGPAAPHLEPTVTAERWFHAPARCGQGPYELDVPVTGARWGEEADLELVAPHAVELHAEILADDAVVAQVAGARGRGPLDNGACVADVHERLATRTRAPSSSGASGGGGELATAPAPVTPGPPIALVPDAGAAAYPTSVVHFAWTTPPRRVRIRVWSAAPNDLTGVQLGVVHRDLRPTVPEADYEAYLARAAAAAAARAPVRTPEVSATAVFESEGEVRARQQRELELERRRAMEAAFAADRLAARERFCASHGEDRDCWGAGGRRVHDELARHDAERARYCDATPDDARCWSAATWRAQHAASRARVELATAPPAEPTGPPPAPLAEEPPPRLSPHAEWRAGYWQWTGATWTWLGGMWRVPESDLAAELTTTAPAAPPPLRAETIAAAPMRALIWVPGFWQWSGAAWVWAAGSWQRPEGGARWRPAEWRARGSVHVLIPGAWVRS